VKSPKTTTYLQPQIRKARAIIAAVLGCLLVLAFASVTASAQTFQSANVTTTLWAGVADVTVTGPGGLTTPTSGVIAHGTAISQYTNGPKGPDGLFACQEPGATTPCNTVRHLWYGDAINGLCRIDPEVDATLSTPVNGFGAWNVNALACLISVQKLAISPGQVTFDAQQNIMYIANNSRVGAGIARVFYHPDGDNGQGMVDLIRVDSLIGTETGRNAFGGCPQLKDPKTGNPVPQIPDAAAIGPDGNLYTGQIRDGAILRIINPSTFNTQTDCDGAGSSGQSPTEKIQIPILAHDELFGSGHTFGLGWIGDTLIGADNIAPWVKFHATQCLTPVNGNTTCGNPIVGGAPLPDEILASAAGAPQGGLASDAQYPFFPGNAVYVASFPNLTRVTNIFSATQMTANLNYGGSFSFLTGVTADPEDPANATVYAHDDQTQGGINGTGRMWRITPTPAVAGPPASPNITSAVAGPGSGQATITWVPTVNGQPILTYDVAILLASPTGGPPTPSGLPDVIVTAPATSATISGLTAGTGYQFQMTACNNNGCSASSPVSGIATPFVQTAPTAPTNVVAVDTGGGSSAAVAWTVTSDGHSPITSSQVSTFTSPGGTLVSTTTLLGAGTGTTITGLACGNSYTFSVTNTNAIGTSPASAQSTPISIACVTAADVQASETSPATANPGAQLTYTITIKNAGPASAPVVQFSDTLPAGFVSATTTQGVCAGNSGLTTFNCNLGSLALNATATVTVTVLLPNSSGTFTNSATVTATNSSNVNVDPNTANNTFSSTTTVGTNSCTATAADVQVTGSSNNGNPVHGSPVTFTWQIKNGTGSINANCVSFTATTTAPTGASLTQNSVSSTLGTCSIASNTVSCNIPQIPGGQTAVVTVQATPSAAAPANSYTTTGKATSTGSDPNLANNQFTVSIGAQ
jgi:uncharacterized repeat protein (TIGR01451 family)